MPNNSVSKFYSTSVALVFIMLAFNVALPDTVAALLFLLAIITIGIPHGALDFYIAKGLKTKPSIQWQVAFLGLYVFVTLISISIWLMFPAFGLSVFLLISVYHFSSDWAKLLPKKIALAFAAVVLCAPSLVYKASIIESFTKLLVPEAHATLISLAMQLLAILSFVFLLVQIKKLSKELRKIKWQIIEIMGLLLSAVLLPPLVHFVLYFCLLHSAKHWLAVSQSLDLNFKGMVLISAPIVLATVVGGSLAWWLLPNSAPMTDILRLVFIGLFGLTVAHMVLIDVWQRQQSLQH
ncbi:Brp/Blh family beta-carotene 15,15'-dioxygenase [Glaciecola petra]|uniref:Probable beta-carotene 15,15'-dioxygenase n=1 Tax=Glaciecola petra TaxID=3075602 RepID=A0ABU2ZR04_9ALTE|nr:Brp/Blh family beta-carotene 15,15'-dioxygenase [Aestuariibacter sp. P117]MDT0594744.1 Brp/Blh family beta-carotene 15,15'-dioxygenase [Aestuariibacter sp. P117]